MKIENTSIRLNKIMTERNLRQVDILELCKPYCQKYGVKLGKNDLSQYVSGKVEPGQKKLSILGMALNLNEVWLMGYDVSPERKSSQTEAKEDFNLLYKFSLLDDRDKKIIVDMIDTMISNKEKRTNS